MLNKYGFIIPFILAIILITFTGINIAKASDKDSVVGKWVMDTSWMELPPEEKRAYVIWTINLRSNGEFESHMDDRLMVDIRQDCTGTYKVDKNKIYLSGTSKSISFENADPKPETRPYKDTLIILNDTLILDWSKITNDVYHDPDFPVFIREGAKPPVRTKEVFPWQKDLKPTTPEALELIKQLERTYAECSSYIDNGSVIANKKSHVRNYLRFHTIYKRPNLFQIECYQGLPGKDYYGVTVWSDGNKSYQRREDITPITTEEKYLRDSLIEIGSTCGAVSTLVPTLLMLQEFENITEDEYRGTIVSQDVTYRGKSCYILLLKSTTESSIKLWIDKSNYLILNAYELPERAYYEYYPKINIPIPPKELKFTGK